MKKSIVAALIAAATLGGAGASHSENASATPLFSGRAEASAGTGVSAGSAGHGDDYAAIEGRGVDATATGAIAFGTAAENNQ